MTPLRSEPEVTGARGLGARVARNWIHSEINSSCRKGGREVVGEKRGGEGERREGEERGSGW